MVKIFWSHFTFIIVRTAIWLQIYFWIGTINRYKQANIAQSVRARPVNIAKIESSRLSMANIFEAILNLLFYAE